MVKAQKGGVFERKMCRAVSLWWTEGARDDIFWRSAGSGAMAKTRSRVGKSTYGQYGDIHAEHPFGLPLLDVFTIELKRGYNRVTPVELLDRGPASSTGKFEGFIDQVREDQTNAGTPFWLLIHKRDRKMIMAYFPREVYDNTDMLQGNMGDHMTLFVPEKGIDAIGIPLDDFFRIAKPDFIHDYARTIKHDKNTDDKELSTT